jgi:hypothetical protein
MKTIKFFLLMSFIVLQACSSLKLEQADFSWPVESVLKVSEDGTVSDDRYSLKFDTKNLFLEETDDSLSYRNKNVRIIRDSKGYYYITSDGFKNIYVFTASDGEFLLDDKINISEVGISNPAFNQRSPYVELLAGNEKHLLLNSEIVSEEDNEK